MFTPAFVPPRHNRLLIRLTYAMLPAVAQQVANIRDVHVAEGDLQRVAALGPGRAVLAPNHPTGDDPIVMFWVSRALRQPFNYLAAREVLVGLKGWLLNQVGAYSVIRGVADRESLRATRRLLAELDRKVVIFPEGEIYEHNDTLLAFQPGVAQIGFWSLEDVVKLKKERLMPLVPVAFKYRCCDAPRPAIENGLRGLEQALRLAADPELSAYDRLVRVGRVMMSAVERELGIAPDEGLPLTERIQAYKARFVESVARRVGTEVDAATTPAEQLHHLFRALREWVGEEPVEGNDYEVRRYRQRLEAAGPIFDELERFQNVIALTGDYVASNPTAERFLEVLGRLEKEVFGAQRTRVAREAHVRIGEPIPLHERYAEYRGAKRETVRAVTAELEGAIRSMLQELSARGTPLSLDF
jgi:hypothetical protein